MARRSAPGMTAYDIAVLAALNVGAADGPIDIEHIAVEAFRLAPDLFRWRHYDYPSAETTRVAIKNAPARYFISGNAGRSRMLSPEGLERARILSAARVPETEPVRDSPLLRRAATRELARLERHPAFRRWRDEGHDISSIDQHDLGDLLYCDPGARAEVFRERLDKAIAQAMRWNRAEMTDFLKECLGTLPERLAREGRER
jgi:hypothetical protein